MKAELERLIAQAVQSLGGTLLPEPVDPAWISVERTRDPSHGDYACNIALRLARTAGKPPREIAAGHRRGAAGQCAASRAPK